MERIVCPNCGFEATSDDFVCPRCEVLLNEAAAELEAVSVVQALLSPSNAPAGRGAPPKNPEAIGDRATVRATVLMDECTVPHMLAGVDLALNPLHQFEAYVTSHVDGVQSVPEIAQKAGITKIEAMAVFQSLAFRRVVELRRTEPPRAPLPPEPEPEPEPVAPAPPLGDDNDEPKTDPAAAPISEEMLAAARAAAAQPSGQDPSTEPAPLPAPAEEPAFDLGPAFSTPAAKPAASPTATTVPARPAVAARSAQPSGAGKRPKAPAFDLGPAFASGEATEPPPKPIAPPSPKLTPMRPSPPRLTPARPATTSQPVAKPAAPAPAPTPAPPRKAPLEDYKLKPSPPKPENVIERAVALEQKGDVEGAIAVLKRAIAQVKNPAPLYNKMALVLIKRKEFPEAVALLEKASALEPDNTVFQQNLYKAVGLVAASKGSGPKRSPGLMSKLLRGK